MYFKILWSSTEMKIHLNVKENESINSWKLITIPKITRMSNDFSLWFTQVQAKIKTAFG